MEESNPIPEGIDLISNQRRARARNTLQKLAEGRVFETQSLRTPRYSKPCPYPDGFTFHEAESRVFETHTLRCHSLSKRRQYPTSLLSIGVVFPTSTGSRVGNTTNPV